MTDVFSVPDNTPKANLPVQNDTEWVGLSKHKIAEFTLCDEDGKPLVDAGNNQVSVGVVRAILVDGEFAVESQYTSPFENSNPESKLPTLLGMLQSGEAAQALGRITENASNRQDGGVVGGLINSGIQAAGSLANEAVGLLGFKTISEAAEALKGRTNLTKINSTQIFVSTQPVRMTLTLFFMALRDPKKEVEDQIQQLQQWALPVSLSDISLLESVANERSVKGLFPSIVPPFISLTYGGKSYKPFLIESVSAPIVAPMDKEGSRLTLSVTMSICSRQAWDSKDVQKLYTGA